MIKVLVVEDVKTVRDYLVYILDNDPDVRVIGTAGDGEEALEFLRKQQPDVITMDIHMPRMDGFEATRRIMESTPTPIIIVSGSSNRSEVVITLQAIEAGALTFVPRPPGIGHPAYEAEARSFVQTIKLMSEVKVVRRWGGPQGKPARIADEKPARPETIKPGRKSADIRIIAVGASTGGPMAIKMFLEALSEHVPAPILMVQHIALGFVQGFVDWLNHSSPVPVRIALSGETAHPGNVYVAPDNFHMGITAGSTIFLNDAEPEHGLRPSVSFLFRSVAAAFEAHAAGVLLTGMGRDGAEELLLMRNRGCITFAQDGESSVINGMPGEAVKLEAAEYILPPDGIARVLKDFLTVK